MSDIETLEFLRPCAWSPGLRESDTMLQFHGTTRDEGVSNFPHAGEWANTVPQSEHICLFTVDTFKDITFATSSDRSEMKGDKNPADTSWFRSPRDPGPLGPQALQGMPSPQWGLPIPRGHHQEFKSPKDSAAPSKSSGLETQCFKLYV